MKKCTFLLLIILFSFWGCGFRYNQKMIDPIFVKDEIKPYISDSLLNVENFNQANAHWCKIKIIANEKENLEFFMFFQNSSGLIYYKNGIQVLYIPYFEQNKFE